MIKIRKSQILIPHHIVASLIMNEQQFSSDYFESDGDTEDLDYDIQLDKNLLLISGSSGVSKTDSVYACAQELGFQVLEVNSSEKRNAVKIQNLIGEATKSQNLTNSTKVSNEVDIKKSKKSLCRKSQKKASHMRIDDFASRNAGARDSSKRRLTLILFDELETIGEDEKGFASAVQSICRSSRRPIVLTSHSNYLSCFSQKLQFSRIQFERQCIRDVSIHAILCLLSYNMTANVESIMLLSMVCSYQYIIFVVPRDNFT